jgi:hypothetical protein
VAATRLHLAPGIRAAGEYVGPVRLKALGAGPPHSATEGRYSPFLGTAVPNVVIERTLHARPGHVFGWALLRDGTDVSLDEGQLTIAREGCLDTVIDLE